MKRLLDLAFALILLLPVAAVVGLLAALVRVVDRHPALFRQARTGLAGRPFSFYKINTMRPPRSETEINDKERDKQRVTQLGLWLRNRGLDELPQVWNILTGQMSFVGPRPLLEKNLDLIARLNPELEPEVAQWRKLRAEVRPGLSGWHQVHSLGPGVLKYDLEYLRDPSVRKHAKVIAASILIILIGKRRYFGT